MISAKENLLIRPWQQRKYEYHKKKVLAATPVIDTKSPPHRGHVAVKLKKLQKEQERSRKIERDNFILLQKLNHIMTTHWLDNYLPPQPTFLSRVGVYRPLDSGIDVDDVDVNLEEVEETLKSKPKCRKLKCVACSPHRLVETIEIPAERVPWEPQKKEVRRRRSSSVPPKRRSEPLPIITEKPKSANNYFEKAVSSAKNKMESAKGKESKQSRGDILLKYPDPIIISRGSLKLSVNFPLDSVVKFDKKRMSGQNYYCRCARGVQL